MNLITSYSHKALLYSTANFIWLVAYIKCENCPCLFVKDSHSPSASKRLENGDSSPLQGDSGEKKVKKETTREIASRESAQSSAQSPPVPSAKHSKVIRLY